LKQNGGLVRWWIIPFAGHVGQKFSVERTLTFYTAPHHLRGFLFAVGPLQRPTAAATTEILNKQNIVRQTITKHSQQSARNEWHALPVMGGLSPIGKGPFAIRFERYNDKTHRPDSVQT
jgi:hypothetical protein